MSERDTYYTAARTWADDRVAAAAKQMRLAWIVAGIAGGIAATLAIALALLLPLKSVQPYVVTVDRQSGAVEIATTLTDSKITQNEAVIQAQLANYVRARESFDETDLQRQYVLVQRLSAPTVARDYVTAMAAANPESPLRLLDRGDTVSVDLKSVSLIGSGAALVRFDKRRSSLNGSRTSLQSHVAAISFGFANAPLRLEDRFDNPLGFQVTRYRRDIEGMPQ